LQHIVLVERKKKNKVHNLNKSLIERNLQHIKYNHTKRGSIKDDKQQF
jgi:hypothetical protein